MADLIIEMIYCPYKGILVINLNSISFPLPTLDNLIRKYMYIGQ